MKRFELERKKLGLTIKDLSKRLDVSTSTVRCWEQGEKIAAPKNFKKLLDMGFDEKALINPTEEV